MNKWLFKTNKGTEFVVTAATMADAEREFETPDKNGNMLLDPGERITFKREYSTPLDARS